MIKIESYMRKFHFFVIINFVTRLDPAMNEPPTCNRSE